MLFLWPFLYVGGQTDTYVMSQNKWLVCLINILPSAFTCITTLKYRRVHLSTFTMQTNNIYLGIGFQVQLSYILEREGGWDAVQVRLHKISYFLDWSRHILSTYNFIFQSAKQYSLFSSLGLDGCSEWWRKAEDCSE